MIKQLTLVILISLSCNSVLAAHWHRDNWAREEIREDEYLRFNNICLREAEFAPPRDYDFKYAECMRFHGFYWHDRY